LKYLGEEGIWVVPNIWLGAFTRFVLTKYLNKMRAYGFRAV
jgi:hypothetical protein